MCGSHKEGQICEYREICAYRVCGNGKCSIMIASMFSATQETKLSADIGKTHAIKAMIFPVNWLAIF